MLNYFNYKKWDKDSFLITNDMGRFMFIGKEELRKFLTGKMDDESELKKNLRSNKFIISPIDYYSSDLQFDIQKMKNYLFSSTSLHIFVVSEVCNLHCVYCQAQASPNKKNGLMTQNVAKKAVDLALQSPVERMTFEFQGGEPLTNFEIIKYIIEYTESNKKEKIVNYTIVSNLSLITDEILEYLIEHKVAISTSLDGPKSIHNSNRPSTRENGSYEYAQKGIEKIKRNNYPVGAIQTTTKLSLEYPEDIIDEYIVNGFNTIFLRPLSPLGFAKEEWGMIGYGPDEFIEFYKKAFNYILKKNKEGIYFKEQQATFFLNKILYGFSDNYMELRSPCGAGFGQLAYYYNGNIYTCDEARMVAESGDDAFLLGNVNSCSYSEIINSKICKATCEASILETKPGCCECVYQPYCGVCPVINYAMEKDLSATSAYGYRCRINKGILDILFSVIRNNDLDDINILKSWVEEV